MRFRRCLPQMNEVFAGGLGTYHFMHMHGPNFFAMLLDDPWSFEAHVPDKTFCSAFKAPAKTDQAGLVTGPMSRKCSAPCSLQARKLLTRNI